METVTVKEAKYTTPRNEIWLRKEMASRLKRECGRLPYQALFITAFLLGSGAYLATWSFFFGREPNYLLVLSPIFGLLLTRYTKGLTKAILYGSERLKITKLHVIDRERSRLKEINTQAHLKKRLEERIAELQALDKEVRGNATEMETLRPERTSEQKDLGYYKTLDTIKDSDAGDPIYADEPHASHLGV